ncbi:hypothetical protein EJ07DRAFT_160347 [Lizonia empirigonia]|nr:hypothetical protein EJ07DRAFT_160347 [Lizonia empirigonia]
MAFDRASAIDYDAWEKLDNSGWNWNGLLLYLKKSATFTPLSAANAKAWEQHMSHLTAEPMIPPKRHSLTSNNPTSLQSWQRTKLKTFLFPSNTLQEMLWASSGYLPHCMRKGILNLTPGTGITILSKAAATSFLPLERLSTRYSTKFFSLVTKPRMSNTSPAPPTRSNRSTPDSR